MAKVRAFVVHDEVGRIVSVARPSKDAKVVILGGDGQGVFETEVDEDNVLELMGGSYRADPESKAVIRHDAGTGKK